MGRRRLGNVPITRRISPLYVALLERLEAAGFDLEAVIAAADVALWTAATNPNYDPFKSEGSRDYVCAHMDALMAKELYGKTWASSYEVAPERFRPLEEEYLERIRRNMTVHRTYKTYLGVRCQDKEAAEDTRNDWEYMRDRELERQKEEQDGSGRKE